MRPSTLESMVVGGIADSAGLAGSRLQAANVGIARRPQRLFHEHVLPAREQVVEDLALWFVRGADESGIVTAHRHLLDRLVVRVRMHGIDRCHAVRARHRTALVPLDAQPYDDYFQAGLRSLYVALRSIASILRATSAGVTGMLPSTSHSQAAAIDPRMVATESEPVAIFDSVA